MYAGIDLGVKKSGFALLNSCEAKTKYVDNSQIFKLLDEVKLVAIDAPLSRGRVWRDCDRAIFFANPLPLNLPSMRKLTKIGIKFKEEIEGMGIKVIESHSNGVKKILGIEARDLGYDLKEDLNEHEIDALFLAFLSFLFVYGAAEGYGEECKIWLPKREVGEVLRRQIRAKKMAYLEDFGKIERFAGVDVHYKRHFALAYACVVRRGKIIDWAFHKERVKAKYVPTLLSLREFDPCVKVLSKVDFDALVANGVGLAHPRAGLATELGVFFNKPSVGVTKKLLCGSLDSGIIFFRGRKVGKKKNNYYITLGHRFSLRLIEKYFDDIILAIEGAHSLAKSS